MLTCRLDTKDDTPNGTNIVQLPVPARIAAPISPSECLSDVTERVEVAPTDNATTVIPAKEWSEPHSKEGPLVIPAREQPESSSRDGFQFPLPAPVACMNRNETRDQATAHPGFQLHSARAPEQADHDRSQK
jgi:hypothetical protein